ncbi:MAG: glycoside hydrolase family 3 protein [Lachnospiraceae bacterium]
MEKMDRDEAAVRRAARRQRRVRNQIMAYSVSVILLLLLVAGIGFGGKVLVDKAEAKKQEEQAKIEATQEAETVEVVSEPASETTEPVTDELDNLVDTNIATMSLEDKVAGLFIVTPEAITKVGKAVQAGDGTKKALEENPVGGLIYFSQNIASKTQLKEMISNTILYSKYPLFIGVDEEGGEVSRLGNSSIGVDKVEAAADIGASGDAQKAYQAATTIATYLTEYGFNLDFAPDADVLTNPDNKVIGTRSYSADASVASSMVQSAVNGLQEQKISACIKYFPGIGDVAEDTHKVAAATHKSLEEMRTMEFLPFIAGIEAGTHMIMVGHISAPEVIGDETPCSLSSLMVTDVLRNELGYRGIVITDAMDMGAITEHYTDAEAAVKALQAGVDMILMPKDYAAAYQGVLEAVKDGTLTEERINESLHRIYRIKYADTGGGSQE